MNKQFVYDDEELELLKEIENDEWIETPLNENEQQKYKESVLYTKSLSEKRQTTIRFATSDLAIIKAKSKEIGIGYQNLIQTLVHNYAIGKIKLEV
jgi:predicted DNA binding CopG/RHH family protein